MSKISGGARSPKRVRKRVMVASGGGGLPTNYTVSPGLFPNPSGSPTGGNSLLSDSSKTRQTGPLRRIRNMLRTLLVMSLPLGIFLIPFFMSSPHNPKDYPPIVVTLSTTSERLPLLQPTLDAIVKLQSAPPTRVYLILKDLVHEDVSRGNVGFQTEQDELERLEVVSPLLSSSSSSWPAYLREMVELTPLQVLQPTQGYGPLTKLIYALQQEELGTPDEPSSTTDSPYLDTIPRIIYMNDDVVPDYKFIQNLMDASIDNPHAAVSFIGGRLRSFFRQVRYAKPGYDKHPNVMLRSLPSQSQPIVVDIVQSMKGVCLPTTLLNSTDIASLFHLTLSSLQEDPWPDFATSADILMSAALAARNVTRMLVPVAADTVGDVFHSIAFTNYSTHLLSASGRNQKNSYDVAMEWMEAVTFLQTKWKVWRQYEFWDPKLLTAPQKQAIVCEALHEPDCDSLSDKCLVSSVDCKDYIPLLKDMDGRDDGRLNNDYEADPEEDAQAPSCSSSSFEEHHRHRHPSGCDSNNNNKNNNNGDGDNLLRSTTPWYLCEAQAVSLWAYASLTTSILIRSLVVGGSWIDLAKADDGSDNNGIINESSLTSFMAIKVVARLLCRLLLLPAKGIHGQSPALFFSNAGILLWVRHRTGVTPHLPTRCCEYMMGRIGSLRMLVGVCLIHLGLCHVMAFVLQQIVATSASAVQRAHRVAMEEGEDGNDNHPWIVDLCRQVFVNAAFVVSLLIVPVLLRLNKVPTWTMLFLVYPIYQYSVNHAGVGDSFSPNALLFIESLDGRPVPTIICRIILGPVIGGLVGGLVMNRYFPDEDAGKYVKSTYR